VLLKTYIKEHWQEGMRKFTPPETSEPEKAYIKSVIHQGLGHPVSNIRTAIGMAIATIADCDWPHAWPELTPTLIQMIRQRNSADLGTFREQSSSFKEHSSSFKEHSSSSRYLSTSSRNVRPR
jgi:hypothetical protein